MDLIRKYYSFLWKKLQKEKGKYIIFNDYLGVDVYIIEKESDKKTINAASRNWQSTYAVKHLNDVVRFANCDDNTTFSLSPKKARKQKIVTRILQYYIMIL